MVKAASRETLYQEAAATYGAALERLARAYERDADKRRDLIQDIHVALWQSLGVFNGRCSLRTWVYRVAHNTITSQVLRRRAKVPQMIRLEDVDVSSDEPNAHHVLDQQAALDRLYSLIHTLQPLDRRVVLLYLEDVDAVSIGEITGLSPSNVATKIHRIKQVLSRRFHEVSRHGA